ncbi:hypothetical protein [Sulfurospirillum multivorans]|uniref:DUF2335 domain-containing protein n=2 Tax=Sulfurospirillum multivorans TaxID=66821 RepID=A0AA86AKL9_SULMK|nr:hypothetical protein [Sulfurospirillum multivorans]AHJ12426.1 hypothetical protein SMUL_1161 [Sulfurospirillum multivorans DSM 12446]QEH05923.1 hypothetical protein SMN_1150 [Sulfurospirillum multivorans]
MGKLSKRKHYPNTASQSAHNGVSESDSIKQQIANIQNNNFNFVQNIDLGKLSHLELTNPELAHRITKIYEDQFEHVKFVDTAIIELEKKEQSLREAELPHQRKFAFRSQFFAVLISLAGLCTAILSMYYGYPWLGGTAITIPIGVVAVNLLGIKNKNQK